jgi:transcriptional regulator
MYVPQQFDETDVTVMHRLIRSHPLGTVVTMTAAGLDANHIPIVLQAGPGPLGTLHGHVSRANPLWREASPSVDALIIFQGPDAYISPSWYPAKQEHGKVVPTWNYVVVHAHGRLRAIDDPAWVRAHVEQLTQTHESHRSVPWQVTDAPADFIASLVKGIVGLELVVTRLTGKWKVGQNRSAADREGAATALESEGTGAARAMADLIRGQRAT